MDVDVLLATDPDADRMGCSRTLARWKLPSDYRKPNRCNFSWLLIIRSPTKQRLFQVTRLLAKSIVSSELPTAVARVIRFVKWWMYWQVKFHRRTNSTRRRNRRPYIHIRFRRRLWLHFVLLCANLHKSFVRIKRYHYKLGIYYSQVAAHASRTKGKTLYDGLQALYIWNTVLLRKKHFINSSWFRRS